MKWRDIVRAVRAPEHGGPEVMRLEHLPMPKLGDGQALVRVEVAGVNYIDIQYRSGAYPVALPVALGSEGAGVVIEASPGVTTVAIGDRVAWAGIPGSYAGHLVAPAERLVPLPEGLDFRDGAAAMLQGMTAHYLTHASYALKPGDTCLVHAAAGGVGLLLCRMATMCGARVIGTVSTPEKAELAREAGAAEVIVYTRQDFVAEVERLTGGAGVQVVYDGVGADTFLRGLDCLATRGYMILFGESSGRVEPLDLQLLRGKGSLYVQRPLLFDHVSTRKELLARAGDVLGWVQSGDLTLRIGAVFSLAEAADAHRALEGRRTAGKVLLIP
jgi:NADPH2:quinone reductase